ncbi:hypothetical protein B0H66DRAFT_601230 [Apodospora peruviana]|uniref:DUF6570 domain-containing protein n=1 Tax=Apodospora peruviana TaxID=516989 RepID=A0AAE0IBP2_9PEZI|nr:hypothetical protein B0H66DRAFT_601230 [Apodospora peruviana]
MAKLLFRSGLLVELLSTDNGFQRLVWKLQEITPFEEKLISLNAAYGFIIKFNIQRGQQTGPIYRKHNVGHVTVFSNDVDSLATILPYPLVSALDQVHVIWTGKEQPTPRDVSKLLSGRSCALRAALQWLQSNNHLYVNIVINEYEMDTWVFESNSDVPTLAYQGMVREQETAEELIRTANIVPPTDRGQDSSGQQPTAEDIVTQLAEISNRSSDQPNPPDSLRLPSSLEATATEMEDYVFELRSSAMFPIGDLAMWPMFAEQDKLDFISHVLQAERHF